MPSPRHPHFPCANILYLEAAHGCVFACSRLPCPCSPWHAPLPSQEKRDERFRSDQRQAAAHLHRYIGQAGTTTSSTCAAPRKGDDVGTNWTEISNPLFMDPGADLMLLHPDGSEEVLVAGGNGLGHRSDGLVRRRMGLLRRSSTTSRARSTTRGGACRGRHLQDPRQDAQDRPADASAVHAEHRRRQLVEGLPHARARQELPSATASSTWVLARCRAARSMFTSNRNAFRPPKRLPHTLQLFVMDDDGGNVECIGHLNLGMALHPVVLTDGRVMFSSLESQGLRTSTSWGLWSIHPDGTNWGPIAQRLPAGREPECLPLPDPAVRRLDRRRGILQPDQQRLRRLRQVAGRGAADGSRRSARAIADDPRNPPLRDGRLDNGRPRTAPAALQPVRHRSR